MRRESDKVKWTSIYHEKKKAEKHPKEHVKK